MKELIRTMQESRQDGHSFVFDVDTKEVLITHKSSGFRHSVCCMNTFPKNLGFLFKDTADMGNLIAGFLNNISEPQIEDENAEDLKTKKQLSSIELLKTSTRDDIYSFVDNTESPVLRDTIVGMLTSLAIEFATTQSTEVEE